MAVIRKRAAVRRDLVQHFVYLAEEASIETAERFPDCAESSFQALASMPLIGCTVEVNSRMLAGVRKWHVLEFGRFLVFYLPMQNGVEIARIIHAAQDWVRALEGTATSCPPG